MYMDVYEYNTICTFSWHIGHLCFVLVSITIFVAQDLVLANSDAIYFAISRVWLLHTSRIAPIKDQEGEPEMNT